jgi:hypothetical protein
MPLQLRFFLVFPGQRSSRLRLLAGIVGGDPLCRRHPSRERCDIPESRTRMQIWTMLGLSVQSADGSKLQTRFVQPASWGMADWSVKEGGNNQEGDYVGSYMAPRIVNADLDCDIQDQRQSRSRSLIIVEGVRGFHVLKTSLCFVKSCNEELPEESWMKITPRTELGQSGEPRKEEGGRIREEVPRTSPIYWH